MALPHLEKLASRYAHMAVEAEKSGDRETAIEYYKRAAEVMGKIIQLYPDNPFRHLYLKQLQEYQNRINYLESLKEPASPGGEPEDDFDLEEMVEEKPRITFKDVADLEHAKRMLRRAVIYPALRPDLFVEGWYRGILLFGPPGCGKTMLGAALSNEIDAAFFNVDAPGIMSKWLGEAEKRVARIFRKARELEAQGRPVIVFIDEVDDLLGTHDSEVGGEARARNQFLKEMDGILEKGAKRRIFVVATTNKPWKLDIGFLRRFQIRVYIPPPDFEVRKLLFKHYTKRLALDGAVDFDELARLTEGYSSSDIRDVVVAVHHKVVEEFIEAKGLYAKGKLRPLTMDDFVDIIKLRRPSIAPEMVRAYEKWNEKYGTMA